MANLFFVFSFSLVLPSFSRKRETRDRSRLPSRCQDARSCSSRCFFSRPPRTGKEFVNGGKGNGVRKQHRHSRRDENSPHDSLFLEACLPCRSRMPQLYTEFVKFEGVALSSAVVAASVRARLAPNKSNLLTHDPNSARNFRMPVLKRCRDERDVDEPEAFHRVECSASFNRRR